MKCPASVGASIIGALMAAMITPRAVGCDSLGNVKFVCGVVNAEDLVAVPHSDWIVASGQGRGGAIVVVNARDKSVTKLFPSETLRVQPDTKTYDSCPEPIDYAAETERFRAHGLNIRPGKNGAHTLYVVHHGNRESVEVFTLNGHAAAPTLTWVGCAVAPAAVSLNAVAPLPDGGFAATNFVTRGDPNGMAKLFSGQITGELWEWHTRAGWAMVPGSETSGANGLEVSKDGKWFYIGGWGSRSFIRLSRAQTPVKKDSVAVDFHIDNLRWQPDGSIYAGGQSGSAEAVLRDCIGQGKCSAVTSDAVKLNPRTLNVEPLIHYPSQEVFIVGTTALQVGKEIWLGTTKGDRIAIFPGRFSTTSQ
jgi:hypothetical protein